MMLWLGGTRLAQRGQGHQQVDLHSGKQKPGTQAHMKEERARSMMRSPPAETLTYNPSGKPCRVRPVKS